MKVYVVLHEDHTLGAEEQAFSDCAASFDAAVQRINLDVEQYNSDNTDNKVRFGKPREKSEGEKMLDKGNGRHTSIFPYEVVTTESAVIANGEFIIIEMDLYEGA